MSTFLYLISVFCLLGFTVLYLRNADCVKALTGGAKELLKWLGIISILFQVFYGGVDIVTGFIVENFEPQLPIIYNLRKLLSLQVPANLAWLTDTLISWWAYVFFARILLGNAEDSAQKAFKLGTIALHFSLLFSLVRLLSWSEISIAWTLVVASIEIAVVMYLLKTFTSTMTARHRDLPLFLAPLLLPLLEPLLGNAFQFFGFLAIVGAALGMRRRSSIGLNHLLHSSAGQWSRWALIYLISLGIPAFLVVANHMTMLPPVMMQFEKPVTVLIFWQVPVLLLVFLIIRGNKTGVLGFLIVIVADLLIRGIILPFYITVLPGSQIARMLSLFEIGPLIYIYQFVFQAIILIVALIPTGFDPGERDISVSKMKKLYFGRMTIRLLAQGSLVSLICIALWQISNVLDVEFIRSRLPGNTTEHQILVPKIREQVTVLQWTMMLGCGVLAFITYSTGADTPRKFFRSSKRYLRKCELKELLVILREASFSRAYWGFSYLVNLLPPLAMVLLAISIWFRFEHNWEQIRAFLMQGK